MFIHLHQMDENVKICFKLQMSLWYNTSASGQCIILCMPGKSSAKCNCLNLLSFIIQKYWPLEEMTNWWEMSTFWSFFLKVVISSNIKVVITQVVNISGFCYVRMCFRIVRFPVTVLKKAYPYLFLIDTCCLVYSCITPVEVTN